jgi:hypothetical protein
MQISMETLKDDSLRAYISQKMKHTSDENLKILNYSISNNDIMVEYEIKGSDKYLSITIDLLEFILWFVVTRDNNLRNELNSRMKIGF